MHLVLVLCGILSLPAVAWAAGSLSVSPSTNLTNGQSVTVSGSGLAHSSTGSILECNSDSNQPTIMVAGNPVPISCTNPLLTLVSTDKNGDLAATQFTVHTGTVGPPTTGTDSSGGSATADAANYPCPPTAAQIATGDSCVITFGDASGDDLSQNISFASQSTPPTTTNPSPTTPSGSTSATTPSSTSKTSSTSATSSLVNTGPGNSLGLFVSVVAVGSLLHYSYTLLRRHKFSKTNY